MPEKISINTTMPIDISFYPSESSKYNLIYLHGGGMLYGNRDDLPGEYIELFNKAGINIFALDYPLAPESKLDQILQSNQLALQILREEILPSKNIENLPLSIFGRSAGAYLAIMLSYNNPGVFKSLLSFYGYYKLTDASFIYPSPHYLQYSKVPHALIKGLIKNQPITSSSTEERFPLYLAARQSGDWMDYLLENKDDLKKYSLKPNQIKDLAPLFLVHSQKDPDVPYRQSKEMSNKHQEAKLVTIDSDEHDFDRTDLKLGTSVYKQAIEWLISHS